MLSSLVVDLQLAGQVALVSGASRGIGHAIALGLAAEGVAVALLALLALPAPDALGVRIKDIADLEGVRNNQLVGYGLVVGLNGTGDKLDNDVGLLKEEMRRLGSIVMRAADAARVPAGAALAVDRDRFAAGVTEAILSHPRITVVREEVPRLPGPESGW
ncbi:MAG: flagellar basal body P-ring protein FlgI, partial [Chloroflexi bacterium]|nr:flagellar basal body P-ring protein FlgI [Chloroflexota bacterium]